MKAVVAAFNQEKALVGAFSVITNLRMELFEALTHIVFFICSGHDFDTGVLVQLRQMLLDETLLSICKIIRELNRDDSIRPLGIFPCTPEEDRSRGI